MEANKLQYRQQSTRTIIATMFLEEIEESLSKLLQAKTHGRKQNPQQMLAMKLPTIQEGGDKKQPTPQIHLNTAGTYFYPAVLTF